MRLPLTFKEFHSITNIIHVPVVVFWLHIYSDDINIALPTRVAPFWAKHVNIRL